MMASPGLSWRHECESAGIVAAFIPARRYGAASWCLERGKPAAARKTGLLAREKGNWWPVRQKALADVPAPIGNNAGPVQPPADVRGPPLFCVSFRPFALPAGIATSPGAAARAVGSRRRSR